MNQNESELPLVSIVIATRNRKAEVLRALDSCFSQIYPAIEVLVFDDGSIDGTAEAIAARFPMVRLFRHVNRSGYIARRNEGFGEAKGKYVFSLDDDAYYSDAGTLEPVIKEFARSPDVGAIAMSYVEPGHATDNVMMDHSEVRSFVGCAHVIRRGAALEVGGYREFLVHQGEERDLCIRLMEQGYRIVYKPTPPIVHCVSSARDRKRMERYGIRNTLLFTTLNVPQAYVLPRMIVDGIRLVLRKPGWPITLWRMWYLLCGIGACLKYLRQRKPVSRATYRRFSSLPRHGPLSCGTQLSVEAPAEASTCSSTL